MVDTKFDAPAAGLLCSSTYTNTLILGERKTMEAFSWTSCTALRGSWQEDPRFGAADVSVHSNRWLVSTARPTYIAPRLTETKSQQLD